jgi:hypothetical protein
MNLQQIFKKISKKSNLHFQQIFEEKKIKLHQKEREYSSLRKLFRNYEQHNYRERQKSDKKTEKELERMTERQRDTETDEQKQRRTETQSNKK